MSAVDTPEAVEAMARLHDLVRFTLGMRAPEHDETAAMLRRLHARAVEAERERDGYRFSEAEVLAENDALRFDRNNLHAALATARADALREAAALFSNYPNDEFGGEECRAAILALIPEKPHAE